jgi:hypothetical protein
MKRLIFFTLITFLVVQSTVLAANNPVLRYTFDANTIQGDTVKDLAGKYDGKINGGAKAVEGN